MWHRNASHRIWCERTLTVGMQELGNTWEKIEQMAQQDKELIVVSRDIKTELGGFYQKVDESANLTSEDHRGYDLQCDRLSI